MKLNILAYFWSLWYRLLAFCPTILLRQVSVKRRGVAGAVITILVTIIVISVSLIVAGYFAAIDPGLSGVANTTYHSVWNQIWNGLNMLGILPLAIIAAAIISVFMGLFAYSQRGGGGGGGF
jgi:hypothetical protein